MKLKVRETEFKAVTCDQCGNKDKILYPLVCWLWSPEGSWSLQTAGYYDHSIVYTVCPNCTKWMKDRTKED